MSQCPSCKITIPEEIAQYGGDCPNCFEFLEGSVGHDQEFEMTGVFTREHLQKLHPPSTSFDDENSVEPETEEVDLEEVLFEDEATEIIHLPKDRKANEGTELPSTEERDELDSDDEPTSSLGRNSDSEDESSEEDPFASKDKKPETLSAMEPAFQVLRKRSDMGEAKDGGSVFEEDSDESFVGQDLDDSALDSSMNSPKEERAYRRETTSSLPKKDTKSFNWKPVALAVGLIGAALAVMFPSVKEDSSTTVEQRDLYIPDIKKEAKPIEVDAEPSQESVAKRQVKRESKKTVEVVEKGGISTFQTAAPVMRGSGPVPTALVSGSSDALENDLNKLKGNLAYCHTKALKTDPTVEGKWEVKFTVSAQGTASGIKITPLRQANKDIETCMQGRIGKFNFKETGSTQHAEFRVVFDR